MRLFLVFCAIALSASAFASNYTIPRAFRGRYKCEVPGYEINHNGKITKVEALNAILLVYKTKIILRIGERSFPANVERKEASRKNPVYAADFPHPFNNCLVSFDRRNKTVIIDAQIFQGHPFKRIK